MPNGNPDTAPAAPSGPLPRAARSAVHPDALAQLKHELLQAEVRLAKARATAVGTEIDIKVLNARLKALVK